MNTKINGKMKLNGAYVFYDRLYEEDVGLEIEVEGGPWDRDVPAKWRATADGSLRGNGVEFVTRGPVKADTVARNVRELVASMPGATWDFSYRTSVHVHVNVQHLTIGQWLSYIVAYGIAEEVLINQWAPERAGNKFCLRFCDADAALEAVLAGVTRNNPLGHLDNGYKYAACNLNATQRMGTLEFRSLGGTNDPDRLQAWVNVLVSLRSYAERFHDPKDIIQDFSIRGPEEWFRAATGTEAPFGVIEELYDGVRLMQDFAYRSNIEVVEVETVGPKKSREALILNPELQRLVREAARFRPAPQPAIDPEEFDF